MFKPRPKQQEILEYTHGKMGVSAVPGSGKTATLSYLAARLVARANLEADQEILIVTLTKSAVGNFDRSLQKYLQEEFKLTSGFGYRVRTLHSFAKEVVSQRLMLVALSESFVVADERESEEILQEAVDNWLKTHADSFDEFILEEHFNKPSVRQNALPQMVNAIATRFIKQAKDTRMSLEDVGKALQQFNGYLPLAQMCYEIFEQYERSLRYRGAIDFQDLIRLALLVMEKDARLLSRLQNQFPYVLEDESQDSSQLQEQILSLLVGKNGNWVRVGDTNQAIYETFTTANPQLLRNFLKQPNVQNKTLPNSGRSTKSIIRLANELIRWSLSHPNPSLRAQKPLDLPYIELTPNDDPQGNPPDMPHLIQFHSQKYTPDEERHMVLKSIAEWLQDNSDKTIAILLPINVSGTKMVDILRQEKIPYVENLRSTTDTRAIVGALTLVLDYLSKPHDSKLLSNVYKVWRRDEFGNEENERSIDNVSQALKNIDRLEDFLYPNITDWLENNTQDNPELHDHLAQFRALVTRWHKAVSLPIDQLVLTIGADLFQLDSAIATTYAIAIHLERFKARQPSTNMTHYVEELKDIAKGGQSFSGMSEDDTAFDPSKHKGKVTVTTLHKAKGLEWDRVYLMSANNYDFPSADEYDSFISERWFIRDKLNLEAEALAQLASISTNTPYIMGEASQKARIQYATERLRLLYVGITRAKSELIISWNNGKNNTQLEARPITYLRAWWQKENN
jgi:DNA helicase II / ATP-dependent DNA helicase PcrA